LIVEATVGAADLQLDSFGIGGDIPPPNPPTTGVSEPAVLVLMGLGLFGIGAGRRCKS
jgi:hypothetical protein